MGWSSALLAALLDGPEDVESVLGLYAIAGSPSGQSVGSGVMRLDACSIARLQCLSFYKRTRVSLERYVKAGTSRLLCYQARKKREKGVRSYKGIHISRFRGLYSEQHRADAPLGPAGPFRSSIPR